MLKHSILEHGCSRFGIRLWLSNLFPEWSALQDITGNEADPLQGIMKTELKGGCWGGGGFAKPNQSLQDFAMSRSQLLTQIQQIPVNSVRFAIWTNHRNVSATLTNHCVLLQRELSYVSKLTSLFCSEDAADMYVCYQCLTFAYKNNSKRRWKTVSRGLLHKIRI